MIKTRTASLTALILLTFFWTLPAYGLVIAGPTLDQAEIGFGDFGLMISADMDTTLLSVDFPNQGLADVIELRRYMDGAVLASIPVPAGNNQASVAINYPLTANEMYVLVATTPNNRYYGNMGMLMFPVTNTEITVQASYFGMPYPWLWFAFNNINTGPGVIVPDPVPDPTPVPDPVPVPDPTPVPDPDPVPEPDPVPVPEPDPLVAVIDIKPGSAINPINLHSKGLVPVAILTTQDLDALTVDVTSVIFAGATPVRLTVQDINGDGNMDLLLHFETADLSDLSSGSTEAVLTGVTADSTPIIGRDSVKIITKK